MVIPSLKAAVSTFNLVVAPKEIMFSTLKKTSWIVAASGFALTAGLMSCQPQSANAPAPGQEGATGASPNTGGGTVALSGAGATFPAPLYQRWFSEYNKENPNVQISYQSVGSGAGVNQYLARTVDFGASDAPLTDEERQQFRSKYNADPIQVPLTGGAVVMAYNLGGDVKGLQLSREAYCGIVQGTVKTWNDPLIAKQNPNVNLPNTPVTFVHRSDGSGTTFIFTNHIDEACPNWTAGAGKAVEWPTGIGGKGNEGVTAQIQQNQGAIGYVEYAYANENNINMASLENQAGQYIQPSPEAAAIALEGQQVPQDFALEIPDPTAKNAYPIVGLTWLLLYPQYDDANKATALKNFVSWALDNGDQYATQLGYLPLSSEVAQRVQSTVNQQIASAN